MPPQTTAEWAEGCREHVEGLAADWGVADAYRADTRALVRPLQAHVDAIDLDTVSRDEIESVHTDLAAFLAEHLIRTFGAHWESMLDGAGPAWVVALNGREVDPFDVAHDEIVHRPVIVARLLAKGEVALGVTSGSDH